MKKFALICTTLLLSALAFQVPFTKWMNSPSVTQAETPGQDGALTVSAANTVVNRYATLAADAAVAATSITVANPGGANGLAPATLVPGSLLLIIQMQGAQIDTSDTVAYGLVTDLRSAGRYEFVTVASVTGNTITFSCGGLRFAYTVAGKTQVIRVPQYSTLTVNVGASIVAPAWNGAFGGVVALNVAGAATINGRVDVSGLGFRGGQVSANGLAFGTTTVRSTDMAVGGEKGEGIAGSGTDLDLLNGRYSRGAPANGGGGGGAHNAGGGGGANGNNGNLYNGIGVMVGTVVGAAAWALDPAFIANGNLLTNSSGGGRGGHGYSDPLVDQNALVSGPGNSVWEGDFRRAVGGLGGRPLANDPSGRIFAGGGGGAAHQNNNNGGQGGNGGGIVFLLGNSLTGTGQILANGSNGADSIAEHRDGGGGGGAGGSVVVVMNSIASPSVEAKGGNGGTHGRPIGRFNNEGHGPGGGGGGGFFAVSVGLVTSLVTGGIHGVSLASTLTEYPVNGATSGATGVGAAPVVSIPFACATDLAILKTSPSTLLAPGGTVVYTIVATNNGPNAVVGAPVVDTLPAALTNASWTCTASGGSSCGAASGNGNINTTVNLAVNGTATFTLTATIALSATVSVSNTATIASPTGAVDPVPGNNSSTYTVQISAGVTNSLRGRFVTNDVCIGPGKFLTLESVLTNNGPGTQQNNPGAEFSTLIPAQLDLVANSCTSTSGQCTITGNRVDWDGTLNAGQSVTIAFQVGVKNSVTTGTRFCITTRANYDSNGDGTNDTTATVQTCATADCVPGPACVGANCGNLGPGLLFPQIKGISDQAAGSVLIFPIYTSNPAQTNISNTRVTITNTSTTAPANVHLFFVDGNGCNVADRYVCLTENQTTTFLTSDLDPSTTGYIVAIASDLNGCPVSHNFLIGDLFVKTVVGNTPFFGNIGAEAVSALYNDVLPGCDALTPLAAVRFNGVSGSGYEVLPRVLALTSILSREDLNFTWLILDPIGGDLATSPARLGTLFGLLFDDAEEPASFNISGGVCQLRTILSNDSPKTVPRFDLIIPALRTGWMKIWQTSDLAMVGVSFNSNTGAAAGINGGHTLHKLTLSAAASYVLPIFPPSC